MTQPVYRSFVGIAKDTINANLTSAIIVGATALPIQNTVGTSGTLTSAGATYSAVIVDGVNTETVACSGNLSAGSIACAATANAHPANVYVYFQLTASIGPTAFIPLTKLDFSDDYAQEYDQGIRGSNVKNFGAIQGIRQSNISLDGDLFADTFGYILSTFFGAYDYSATGGGNPTTYAFSPLNTTTAQPTPYLFYLYNPGANNTRVFAKVVCSDLTVKVDPGALASWSGTFKGFASGVVATPTPSYSTFTPVAAWHATATVGGTVTPKVLTAEYQFKRENFAEVPTLQGIQDPYAIFAGPATCAVKTTLVVDDDVQLGNYINASQPSFVLSCLQGTGTAANGIKIQNTKANYEAVKTVIDTGKGFVTLEVPFTALANTTDKSTAGGGYSPALVTISTGTVTGTTLY